MQTPTSDDPQLIVRPLTEADLRHLGAGQAYRLVRERICLPLGMPDTVVVRLARG